MDISRLMVVRIGIFYKNRVWREHIFDYITNHLQQEDWENVERMYSNNNKAGIYFKNGSSIRFIRANENARGYKLDKAFVEVGIDHDVIERVIKPCILSNITLLGDLDERV